MTARPPALTTASAISRESVATATGPIPASTARRHTWTIIGSPPISARGLLGSRVAARRAGIRRMGSDIALRVEERTGVLTKTAVVCHGRRHGKDGQTAVGTGPAGGDLAPRERN